MYRGTTPTICFSLLSRIDMNRIAEVWLTFKMARDSIVFRGDRVSISAEDRKMYVTLTQEETLLFCTGTAKVQARILMDDGMAYASDVGEVEVKGILTDGVIEHDDSSDSDDDGGDGTDSPDDGGGGDGTDSDGAGGGEGAVPDGRKVFRAS